MINEISSFFSGKFPLAVTAITWDDYNLNLCGDGWTFNTTSCWRIINEKGFFGINDKEAETQIKTLVGRMISHIEHFGNIEIDISFKFSDNTVLQIFCSSYFEPWIFSIEGYKTFVAAYDPQLGSLNK